jgi:hypothetical protein
MYEARLGAFDYTIERRLASDGSHTWLWRVRVADRLVAAGESPRSHAHAETEVQSYIFLAEAKERAEGSRPARHTGALS